MILNNSSVNKFTNTLSHKLNVSSWTPLSLSCFLFLSYHYFHIFLLIDFCNWFSNIDFKKLTSGFIKQTLLSGQICFFIIFVLFIFFNRIYLHTTKNIVLSALKSIPLSSTIRWATDTEKQRTVWTWTLA